MLVGLEQTTNSVSLHEYRFPRRTALVIGNERPRPDRRRTRAGRCRRRNPRLGPALRLQRRQRHRHGPLRILPQFPVGESRETVSNSQQLGQIWSRNSAIGAIQRTGTRYGPG